MRPVKPITLRHDLHALSLLFQYGQKHNWCRGNPAREVDIPSDKDATRCNVLSPAEEARWFAAIDALMGERLARGRLRQVATLQDIRDLSTMMLNQGCRPEELRALPQTCVDLEKGTLTIRQGKSAAARRVLPLTLASRDIMVRRLQRPGRWVFPKEGGGADRGYQSSAPDRTDIRSGAHIGQAQRWVEAVAARAGLTMVLYDLRHTWATRAVERGVDLPTLAALLGHANLRSVMRYVHIRQSQMNTGMAQFMAAALVVEERDSHCVVN